jgi:hypothetical protein
MASLRRQQMNADYGKYGKSQEGVHLGIKWTAKVSELAPWSPRSDPRNTEANTLHTGVGTCT